MKLARILIVGYLVIGLLYAFYAYFWGPYINGGTAFTWGYRIAEALFWPAAMFPALKTWLTGVVIVAVIAARMRR